MITYNYDLINNSSDINTDKRENNKLPINYLKTIRNISLNSERNDKIIKRIKELYQFGLKILVLTGQVNQISLLADKLKDKGFKCDNANRNVIKVDSKILIITFLRFEGMIQYSSFDVLILATPKKEIRKYMNYLKDESYIYNFIDDHNIFKHHKRYHKQLIEDINKKLINKNKN